MLRHGRIRHLPPPCRRGGVPVHHDPVDGTFPLSFFVFCPYPIHRVMVNCGTPPFPRLYTCLVQSKNETPLVCRRSLSTRRCFTASVYGNKLEFFTLLLTLLKLYIYIQNCMKLKCPKQKGRFPLEIVGTFTTRWRILVPLLVLQCHVSL